VLKNADLLVLARDPISPTWPADVLLKGAHILKKVALAAVTFGSFVESSMFLSAPGVVSPSVVTVVMLLGS
jgi:hypothetical protein